MPAPGEFAVLARRKGRDWWLVGINAGTPREVTVPLDFLKPGTYKAKFYHDAPDSKTVGFDVKSGQQTVAIQPEITHRLVLADIVNELHGLGLNHDHTDGDRSYFLLRSDPQKS